MDTALHQDIKDFYAVWQRLDSLYEQLARLLKLGGVHALFTLCALHEYTDGCTQKQICEEWVMPKQTVSTILKAMEHAGYVFHSPSATDGRSKIIRLTDAGKAYVSPIVNTLLNAERHTLAQMGSKNRRAMLGGMSLFCDIFSKEIEKVGTYEHP